MKPGGSSRIAAAKQTKQHTSGEVNLVIFDLSWWVLQAVILIIVTWPQRVFNVTNKGKFSQICSSKPETNQLAVG